MDFDELSEEIEIDHMVEVNMIFWRIITGDVTLAEEIYDKASEEDKKKMREYMFYRCPIERPVKFWKDDCFKNF